MKLSNKYPMHLYELAFSKDHVVEIVSDDDLDLDLIGAGAKQVRPGFWFFPGGDKAVLTLMKRFAKRGIFTLLQK